MARDETCHLEYDESRPFRLFGGRGTRGSVRIVNGSIPLGFGRLLPAHRDHPDPPDPGHHPRDRVAFWVRRMRTMGAREAEILYHVKIPASAPALFSGLKIAATYSIMAAVLAEWAGGGEGLGIYMLRTKRAFRFDAMFASIIWIVVLSLLLYQAVIGIEKRVTPWRRGQERR